MLVLALIVVPAFCCSLYGRGYYRSCVNSVSDLGINHYFSCVFSGNRLFSLLQTARSHKEAYYIRDQLVRPEG